MSAERNEVPILVIGASLVAFGIACRQRDQVLVMEPSALVGAEFIDSLNPGEDWSCSGYSELACDLYGELQARNIVTHDGRVHIPALAPVLFNRIKREQLAYMFMTSIVSVKEQGHGYEVTLYGNSGYMTIQVGVIVDTTATVLSQPGFNWMKHVHAKSIHAMLHTPNEEETITSELPPGIGLISGRFAKEVIMSYPLEVADDYIAAREKLMQFWLNRPASFGKWEIAAISSTFSYQVTPGPIMLNANWVWLPSAAYQNPLSALDAGQAWDFDAEVVNQ